MILVIGATGHSGGWFIKKLKAEGCAERIRCLVRPTSNVTGLTDVGLDIEIVEGDLEDKEFLKNAMEGCKTIIHFAGIKFSRNVLQVGDCVGIEWFIFVHTTGRFSKYKSAAAGYIEIEDKIASSSGNVSILRPTIIYGSKMDRNLWKLIDYLYHHKFFPVFGNGKNLMQPIHAKDLGEAVHGVLINRTKTFNRSYNVAGTEAISYQRMLEIITRELKTKVIFVHLPIRLSIAAARVYGWVAKNPKIKVEQVMRMNEDKAFSYDDARNDFGYSPRSFEEGITGEVAEYLRFITQSRD